MKKLIYSFLGLIALFVIPYFIFSFLFSSKEVQSKIDSLSQKKRVVPGMVEDNQAKQMPADGKNMEWLEVIESSIPYEKREQVLYIDSLVWTNYLKKYPFFISKRSYVQDQDSNRTVFLIRWTDRRFIDDISLQMIDSVDQIFLKEMKRIGLSQSDYVQHEIQQYELENRFSTGK